MTGPLVSVFTPVHNKAAYAPDAIRSVLAQDMPDFEYWILENSTDSGVTRGAIAPLLNDPRVIYEEIEFTRAERMQCYPPAVLLNRYMAKAAGEYVCYISDDDVFELSCFRRCVEAFGAGPERMVVWFGVWIAACRGGGEVPAGAIPADGPLGFGTAETGVDCRIDGGQIMWRRDALEQIERPWYPETPVPGVACHSDGLMMQKLARRFTFWPVPEFLLTHRRTPLSTWDRC